MVAKDPYDVLAIIHAPCIATYALCDSTTVCGVLVLAAELICIAVEGILGERRGTVAGGVRWWGVRWGGPGAVGGGGGLLGRGRGALYGKQDQLSECQKYLV